MWSHTLIVGPWLVWPPHFWAITSAVVHIWSWYLDVLGRSKFHHASFWWTQPFFQNGACVCHPCFCLFLKQVQQKIAKAWDTSSDKPRLPCFQTCETFEVHEIIHYYCFSDRIHDTTNNMRCYISLIHIGIGKDHPWTNRSVIITYARTNGVHYGTEHLHQKWYWAQPKHKTVPTCQVAPSSFIGLASRSIESQKLWLAMKIQRSPLFGFLFSQCLW